MSTQVSKYKKVKLLPKQKRPSAPFEVTSNTDEAEQWIADGFNVGLHLENLVLIDIDSYKRTNTPEIDTDTVIEILGHPKRTIQSGGGGRHLIYDLPVNLELDTKSFRKDFKERTGTSKGIDIKSGAGSISVDAESLHPSGSYYKLIKENPSTSFPKNHLIKKAEQQATKKIELIITSTDSSTIYSGDGFVMESIKNNGLDSNKTQRHKLAWDQACRIADKLQASYGNNLEIVKFGASILHYEILNHEYVSSKVKNHKDKGWRWTYKTIKRAFDRNRRIARTPNHVKSWTNARSTLLELGWKPVQIAALDTILERCYQSKSSKFWISARQFKEMNPVADYQLLKFLVEEGVIEIVEKGNMWSEMATIYRLQPCPYQKGANIDFKFNDSYWVNNPIVNAHILALLNKSKTLLEISDSTGLAISTIKNKLRRLTRDKLVNKSNKGYIATQSLSKKMSATVAHIDGKATLAARKEAHQKERTLFQDYKQTISVVIKNSYNEIKNKLKQRTKKNYNNKVLILSQDTYTKVVGDYLRSVMRDLNSITITKAGHISFNLEKFESQLFRV